MKILSTKSNKETIAEDKFFIIAYWFLQRKFGDMNNENNNLNEF